MHLRRHRLAGKPAAAAVSLALALAFAPPALAQSDADRATARSLGQDGQAALDSKDYKTAEDRFRRADKLVHAPTLMLGLARSLAGNGKYVEAQETYNRMVREGLPPGAPDVFKKALEDAKREVDQISPKVCGVTITVQAAGGGEVPSAKVTLDEAAVNVASLGVRREIDPGGHVLRVTADGFKPAEVRFSVTDGGSINEPVTLDKDPNAVVAPTTTATTASTTPTGAPPSSSTPPQPEQPATKSHGGSALPWVAFGVGGAGLAVGAVTGIIAMGKHSDLAKACTNGVCGPDQQSSLDSYHSMGTISTIGFIVGGVGVAAGVVLLLAQPKAEASASAAPAAGLHVFPVVGPGSLGAVGSF